MVRGAVVRVLHSSSTGVRVAAASGRYKIPGGPVSPFRRFFLGPGFSSPRQPPQGPDDTPFCSSSPPCRRKKVVVAQLFSHDSDRRVRLRPPFRRANRTVDGTRPRVFVCDPRYAAKPNSARWVRLRATMRRDAGDGSVHRRNEDVNRGRGSEEKTRDVCRSSTTLFVQERDHRTGCRSMFRLLANLRMISLRYRLPVRWRE